ncbi:MAG: hypothetical protein LUG16_05565 [Candidatus Gastranaerophilales bacterium]|nr:hypothetical protein [Candidatus Gastranaerophilales bacterium]
MAISIRAAVKNIFSEKYNKFTLFQTFVLIFITGIYSTYVLNNGVDPETQYSWEYFAKYTLKYLGYLLLGVITGGVLVQGLNNIIFDKEQVYPSLKGNLKSIAEAGFKNILGNIVIWTIFWLIIYMFVYAIINSVYYLSSNGVSDSALSTFVKFGQCFCYILQLIFALTYMGLFFNFAVSLKFRDFFNFKKLWKQIKCSKFWIFLVKLTLVIVGILIIVIAAMLAVLYLKYGMSGFNTQTAGILKSHYLFKLSMLFLTSILFIFYIDLSSQYLSDTKSLHEEEKPAETEEKVNE